MRFLADMGISPQTAQWLRDGGHDCVHLRDQGLQRLPDKDVLAKARTERRILLTCDTDFGHLMAVSAACVPSVVLFRTSDMRPCRVEAHLADVLPSHPDDLEAGAMIVVTDKRVRVRLLPVGRSHD